MTAMAIRTADAYRASRVHGARLGDSVATDAAGALALGLFAGFFELDLGVEGGSEECGEEHCNTGKNACTTKLRATETGDPSPGPPGRRNRLPHGGTGLSLFFNRQRRCGTKLRHVQDSRLKS